MTSASEHERILQAVVAGDLAADASPAREHLEGCMECRGRLEEIASARAELERDGALFREVRASGAGRPLTDAERASMDAFERRVIATEQRAAPSPSRARRWPWIALPLLAAAAIAAYVAFRGDARPDANESPYLGPANIRVIAPDGVVERFDAIEWTADVAIDQRVELRIEGRAADERERSPIATILRAKSPWTPTPEFVARAPVEIWYTLTVVDVHGQVLDASDEVHARLRSGSSRPR